MKNQRIFVVISLLIIVGIACGLSGNGSDQGSALSDSNGSVIATDTPTSSQTISTNVSTQEEAPSDELPPMSLDEVFQAGIDAGNWTFAEGLLLFMQYLAGEINADELPGVSEVQDADGTEMVQQARLYLNLPDRDPSVSADLEQLFRKLFPPQDVLDAISEPYTTFSSASGKLASIRPVTSPKQIYQGTCTELYENGFNPADLGITCYLIKDAMADDLLLQVYFPVEWYDEQDEEWLALVDMTIDALKTSMEYYNVIPNLTAPNVNMIFSLQASSNNSQATGNVLGRPESADACPATIDPIAYQDRSEEEYKQLIAYLSFYCVQLETFGFQADDAWWFYGTAAYFSNQVYPFANYEHRKLPYFDQHSVSTPIDGMTYENFVFFQWLGNQIGEDGIVNVMHTVSEAGGDINAFALMDADYFEGHFNSFVVEYLSTGILDTNGRDRIKSSSPPRVSGTRVVADEGDFDLPVTPWVAHRYFVDYKQEMRFLQTQSNSDFAFSSVELPQQQDIGAWSTLPPEIRSSCEEDVRYLFVPTTTYNDDPYKFVVTTAETASCDPCLLGVWAIDNDSFEEYSLALFEQEGVDPVEGVSQFGEFTFEISGNYYLGFGENGKMAAWRDQYTITVGAGGFIADTIISSNGLGTYSADGEILAIHNLYDYVTDLKLVMDGTELAPPPTFDGPDYSLFKQSYSPERRDEITSSSGSQPYTCEDDSLAIEMEPLGEIRFNRVDEIIPTPAPTPQN